MRLQYLMLLFGDSLEAQADLGHDCSEMNMHTATQTA